MALYLIQPSVRLMPGSLREAVHPHRRAEPSERVRAISNARTSSPSYQTLESWLDEIEQSRPAPTPRFFAPVTGITFADLTEEEASRLQRDIPGVFVLPDQPIDLIRTMLDEETVHEELTALDLWHLDAIGLVGARRRANFPTGRGVTVALLDTGVNPDHPNLVGKIDRTVHFDVQQRQSLVVATSRDTDGHGTQMAGLICGRHTGIAPEARLIDVLMMPRSIARLARFVLAMEWVAKQTDLRIVNMSAGLPGGFTAEMMSAISGLLAMDILPVIAVGNEGRNQSRSPGNYIEPLTVGASTRESRVAELSGGGKICSNQFCYNVPDLVAPGEGVFSSLREGGYGRLSGTSAAAAIVTGMAALLLERFPLIRATELIEELMGGCMNLGFDIERQGKGLVRVTSVF